MAKTLWKGYIAKDGTQIYANMPLRDGEEVFMMTATTRKELFLKLDKAARDFRK